MIALLLLLTTVGVAAAAAGAGDKPKGAPRDAQAILKDIKDGKATRVDTPASRIRRTTGVWTGCEFVYLTTKITDWVTTLGENMRLSEDPDPLPPRTCLVTRNPTDEEMAAMRAVVQRANAAGEPADAGSRPIPPEVVAAQNSVGRK